MEIIVFESEAYYKMIKEFRIIVQEMNEKEKEKKDDIDWISAKEAKCLLKIKSKTTLQKYCQNGYIVFTKHARIVLYSRKSIVEFLNNNAINKQSPLNGKGLNGNLLKINRK